MNDSLVFLGTHTADEQSLLPLTCRADIVSNLTLSHADSFQRITQYLDSTCLGRGDLSREPGSEQQGQDPPSGRAVQADICFN